MQTYKPGTSPRVTSAMTRVENASKDGVAEEEDSDEDAVHTHHEHEGGLTTGGLGKLFPSWSTSKFARAHRQHQEKLPPGVQRPTYWIKDQGEVKVEPKVWLANQRTFVKWQHMTVLLATLSLGLYNAAGPNNTVGRTLGAVYTVIALFTGIWGWGVYMWRSSLIRKRSGKDFDARIGPVIICVSLMVALLVNIALKVRNPFSADQSEITSLGTEEVTSWQLKTFETLESSDSFRQIIANVLKYTAVINDREDQSPGNSSALLYDYSVEL
jgi:uncharacterized membrane protein YidH (DUF202 family)